MHVVYILVFTIPLLSIIGIGLYQILDEMRKKKFILERRQASASDEASAQAPKRRYSDAVAAKGHRHAAAENSESTTEAPVV